MKSQILLNKFGYKDTSAFVSFWREVPIILQNFPNVLKICDVGKKCWKDA